MSGPLVRLASTWTQVDGLRAHALVSDEPVRPEATPVVLVHGLVVSSRYLAPTAERLGAYAPVHAPDLPGFGRSEAPPRPLDLAGLADALAGYVRAAGLARVALLGNSFGCQIAVECALRHPDLVERLILQGPTTDRSARSLLRQIGRWILNALREPSGMTSIIVRDYLAAGFTRFRRTLRAMMRDAIEDKMARIEAPVLVVSGERDPIAPPRWGEELARRAPHARHATLEGTAHTAVFHAPDVLLRVVRPFLADAHVPARGLRPDPGPPFVAGFDSATSMVQATARALHGEDFSGLGLDYKIAPLLPLVNKVPERPRELIYSIAGRLEAERASHLGKLDLEEVYRWAASQYPERRYPAVFLGSSNGAIIHLAAAMGVPVLPQTFLLAVKHAGDPNDLRAQMEWGRGPGAALLRANPDVELHHMVDPAQDQLMARYMSYFRFKLRALGPSYEQFLANRLEPGGTIFLLECGQSWPCTRVGERHFFQSGAVGGLSPEEYRQGSPRIEAFLQSRRAGRTGWDPPEPDIVAPEAEWGFAEALREDVMRAAERLGLSVVRVRYDEPMDMSGFVADLYRAFYAERGLPTERLLVGSFLLLDPWWTLRTASVPFWTVFPVESAAAALSSYVDRAGPFEEIYATLFSHGVNSPGVVSAERWRALVARAQRKSALVGVDEDAFPRDMAALVRFQEDLRRTITARYPLPEPLSLERLAAFISKEGARYPVRWLGMGDRGAAPKAA